MFKEFKKTFFKLEAKERRRSMRLAVHHLLKYRIVEKPPPEKPLSFVRNISAGGLLFYTHEYIPLGSLVELQISFPPLDESICVLARVVWIKFLPRIGGFNIGVEFFNIEDKIKEFINSKVLRVYEKKKEKKGEIMRLLAGVLIVLGVIGTILGAVARFRGFYLIPIAPSHWINLINMLLLFSIALSVLSIARRK